MFIYLFSPCLTLKRISGKEIWCESEEAENLGQGPGTGVGGKSGPGRQMGYRTVCLRAGMCKPRAWSRKCSVDVGRTKTRTQGPWVLRPEGSVVKHPDTLILAAQ